MKKCKLDWTPFVKRSVHFIFKKALLHCGQILHLAVVRDCFLILRTINPSTISNFCSFCRRRESWFGSERTNNKPESLLRMDTQGTPDMPDTLDMLDTLGTMDSWKSGTEDSLTWDKMDSWKPGSWTLTRRTTSSHPRNSKPLFGLEFWENFLEETIV